VNTQNQTQRPHPTATLRPVIAGTRRRLPGSTQNPIQRQHPRDTIRMLVTETRRRSRQSKKRRICAPPRHSGTSCKPLTVFKTRLQRPPKTDSGTPPRHQTEASLENHRNPTRKRGTDGEYTDPTTTTTLLGDIDTLTNTTTSRPNPKRCIQVGSKTYVVTPQPGTSYTS